MSLFYLLSSFENSCKGMLTVEFQCSLAVITKVNFQTWNELYQLLPVNCLFCTLDLKLSYDLVCLGNVVATGTLIADCREL